MKNVRNSSIDIFRIICAILVVSIHTRPFEEVNSYLGYVFYQVFPRIAVPFFFCTIGYYYIGNLTKNKNVCKDNLKKFLKIYILWSCIYFLFDFILKATDSAFNLFDFIKKCLIDFFWFGSYYHLWFFQAIILVIIIISFFYKKNKLHMLAILSIILYILGLLGMPYYKIGNKIPIINNFINSEFFRSFFRSRFCLALPFCMQGYFLRKIMGDWKKDNKILSRSLIITTILFLLEIFFVNIFNLQCEIIITIFLYPLLLLIMILLLNNPMIRFSDFSKKTRDIANFMYYSHPIFIYVISFMGKKVFGSENLNTFNFISVVIVTISIGYFFNKLDNKYLNKLYK